MSGSFGRNAAMAFAELLAAPTGLQVHPLQDSADPDAVQVGPIVVASRPGLVTAERFGPHLHCGPTSRCSSCTFACWPERPLAALLERDAVGQPAHTALQLDIACAADPAVLPADVLMAPDLPTIIQVRAFVLGSPAYSDLYTPLLVGPADGPDAAGIEVLLAGGACAGPAQLHRFGSDGRLTPVGRASSGELRCGAARLNSVWRPRLALLAEQGCGAITSADGRVREDA